MLSYMKKYDIQQSFSMSNATWSQAKFDPATHVMNSLPNLNVNDVTFDLNNNDSKNGR